MKRTSTITAIALALWASASAAPAFTMQKCVNMGNSLEAPRDVPWGKPIDATQFPVIRSMGVDTVRIPVRWSDYTGPAPDYAIEADFLADVDAAVTAALAADLNVILNIHHFEEIMKTPKAEFRHLLSMWRQIATHFADAPDRLWFEVLNEPFDALNGDVMRNAQTVGVLAIRESNPTRVIILGGEDWSSIRSLGSNIAPPDDNIVYTFHYYDPFDFTHQKAEWLGDAMPKGTRGWGSAADRAELAAAAETATTFKAAVQRPVFLGEFGVYDRAKQGDRVEWIKSVRTQMEDAGIPWCLWAYSNTFALYDNDKATFDKDVVEALGLTLPSR